MMTNLLRSAFVANKLFSTIARLRLLLLMFLTLTVTTNAWGATWEKATSIAAGDVVLLVCESKKMELSGVNSYGSGTAYSTSPAGLYELTVEAGSSSGTFSLKNGNNYLYWNSGNSLATNATKSANTSWKVTFSNGNATISNAKDNSRKLQWNASSPRFACYTTSQTAVQLYKKVSTDPCASLAAPIVTTTNITNNSFTLSWNAVAGAESYNVYNYTTDVAENITITSYTFTELTPNTEYEWEIETVKSTCSKGTTGTTTTRTLATITLSEAGVETPVTGKYVGDSYTLPSTTSQSCGDLEFVGWSTVEINNSASKPASNYYAKGASVTLAANQTFYAVFAIKTTTTGGTTTTEKTKTETFENQTAGSVYNSTQTYAAANSNAGIAWKMYYGTVSTNAYLSGSKSAQMRWYDDAPSNLPYVQTTTIVKGLKSISFKTLTSDNDYKYSVSYSTNNSTWTNVATSQSVGSTSSTQTKSYTINANGVDAYIKIAITSTSNVSDKATFRIDDVVFTYLETTAGGTTTTYSDYTTQCNTKPTVCVIPRCGGDGGGTWLVVIEWFATF